MADCVVYFLVRLLCVLFVVHHIILLFKISDCRLSTALRLSVLDFPKVFH